MSSRAKSNVIPSKRRILSFWKILRFAQNDTASLINLIIDRTFIDEHGIRWIIDYKTSTLSHQDLEDFLANEQKKYLQQMQKYQQAMRAIEDRPIQLGLYFPALPAWKAWDVN